MDVNIPKNWKRKNVEVEEFIISPNKFVKLAQSEDLYLNVLPKLMIEEIISKICWQLDEEDVTNQTNLQRSGEGEIYQGLFNSKPVIVKKMPIYVDNIDDPDLNYWLSFKKKKNPYIVDQSGWNLISPMDSPCLYLEVREFYNWNLTQYLKKSLTWTWFGCFSLIFQLVNALDFLHKHDFMHRHLCPANVLIQNDGTLKLSDFGCTQFIQKNEQMSLSQTAKSDLVYVAIELYYGSAASFLSDIYSFGIILSEILTRCVVGEYRSPCEGVKLSFDSQIFAVAARKGVRPTLPESCPAILSEIYTDCVSDLPETRFTSSELTDALKGAKREYENNKSGWDRSCK